MSTTANPHPVTLAIGVEDFLVERAVSAVVRAGRRHHAHLEVTTVAAGELAPASFDEVAGPSLFGAPRVVVLSDIQDGTDALIARIVEATTHPEPDVAVVLTHAGGTKNAKGVKALKAAGVHVVVCDRITRPRDLADFVRAEARHARGRIDESVVTLLVDAVGSDLRSLASAVAQLLADGEGTVDHGLASQYFEGRAEVKGWTVAETIVGGDQGAALRDLRWALATGTVPVLIIGSVATSLRTLALAIDLPRGMREDDAARALGVPPWKVSGVRQQARAWTPRGVARALRATSDADLAVKGGANDATFTLSRLVVEIADARAC